LKKVIIKHTGEQKQQQQQKKGISIVSSKLLVQIDGSSLLTTHFFCFENKKKVCLDFFFNSVYIASSTFSFLNPVGEKNWGQNYKA
jgi:hypothetical protein